MDNAPCSGSALAREVPAGCTDMTIYSWRLWAILGHLVRVDLSLHPDHQLRVPRRGVAVERVGPDRIFPPEGVDRLHHMGVVARAASGQDRRPVGGGTGHGRPARRVRRRRPADRHPGADQRLPVSPERRDPVVLRHEGPDPAQRMAGGQPVQRREVCRSAANRSRAAATRRSSVSSSTISRSMTPASAGRLATSSIRPMILSPGKGAPNPGAPARSFRIATGSAAVARRRRRRVVCSGPAPHAPRRHRPAWASISASTTGGGVRPLGRRQGVQRKAEADDRVEGTRRHRFRHHGKPGPQHPRRAPVECAPLRRTVATNPRRSGRRAAPATAADRSPPRGRGQVHHLHAPTIGGGEGGQPVAVGAHPVERRQRHRQVVGEACLRTPPEAARLPLSSAVRVGAPAAAIRPSAVVVIVRRSPQGRAIPGGRLWF